MTKRQLIDEIIALNETAKPVFLARFPEPDLQAYREHLLVARTPRLWGDPGRYDKYFVACRASTGRPVCAEPPACQEIDPSPESRVEAVGDTLSQEQPAPATLFEAELSSQAADNHAPSAAEVAGEAAPLVPQAEASEESSQSPESSAPSVQAVVEMPVAEEPAQEPAAPPVALEPIAAPPAEAAAASDQPEAQNADEPAAPEPEAADPDDEQADEAQQQVLTPTRTYYAFLPSYRSSETEDQDDRQESEDSQPEPHDSLAEEPADSQDSPQPVTAGASGAGQEPPADGSESWLF